MKATSIYLLIAISMCSCGSESTTDRYDRFMSELQCPIILIGKTESAVDNPAITVRDGNGLVRTFKRINQNTLSGMSEMPSAIGSSRCIGDTLKPCK